MFLHVLARDGAAAPESFVQVVSDRKMTAHDDYCLQEYKYLYDRGILNGSVAFITGGGSGIGFRIAELFMRHGCDTAIASRNIQKLEEVYNVQDYRFKLAPSNSCSLQGGSLRQLPGSAYQYRWTLERQELL